MPSVRLPVGVLVGVELVGSSGEHRAIYITCDLRFEADRHMTTFTTYDTRQTVGHHLDRRRMSTWLMVTTRNGQSSLRVLVLRGQRSHVCRRGQEPIRDTTGTSHVADRDHRDREKTLYSRPAMSAIRTWLIT